MKYPLNNAKNNGVTAVGIAAFKGNLTITDLLYKGGADINLTSKHGAGPLYLAIKQENMDCVKYLIERSAFVHLYDPMQSEYSPLFQSIKLGNFAAVELICDTGIDIDSLRDSEGLNPLSYAIVCNQDSIANYLSLRVHNLDDEDPQGFTAFSRYALNNSFEQANRLLQRGAKINYSNIEGKTALTLAILTENENSVKFLLGKGADPHQ